MVICGLGVVGGITAIWDLGCVLSLELRVVVESVVVPRVVCTAALVVICGFGAVGGLGAVCGGCIGLSIIPGYANWCMLWESRLLAICI